MTGIRVLLADDHQLVRAGLRELLQGLGDIQVVGEASNGREALQMAQTLRPDVVLMDIGMHELNGLEATARVSRDFPDVRVIILSMHADREYVLRAFRAGAAGYLLKDADPAQLEMAVKAVAAGGTFLSPSVSKHVIADYVSRPDGPRDQAEALTPRQREILQLIVEGRTKHEIAQLLNISPKTVEAHRDQLMERLGIYDLAGLIRYAIKTRLVSVDP